MTRTRKIPELGEHVYRLSSDSMVPMELREVEVTDIVFTVVLGHYEVHCVDVYGTPLVLPAYTIVRKDGADGTTTG